MAKFIELHKLARDNDGNMIAVPELVNLEAVERIKDIGKACEIQTRSENWRPVESYEQVRLLVGACCGGIPIPRMDSKIAGLD